MPSSGFGTVRIKGLRELNRELKRMPADLKAEMREELRHAGEPVREEAEQLARQIRNIGERWPRMRLGITGHAVYVAPKTKTGRGSKRPNLAGLLVDRMVEALDHNRPRVIKRLEVMLDRLGRKHGF